MKSFFFNETVFCFFLIVACFQKKNDGVAWTFTRHSSSHRVLDPVDIVAHDGVLVIGSGGTVSSRFQAMTTAISFANTDKVLLFCRYLPLALLI